MADRVQKAKTKAVRRNYRKEYLRDNASEKRKDYRKDLQQYNRDKGTHGNGDKLDASHKGGRIVGFEPQSKNRARK